MRVLLITILLTLGMAANVYYYREIWYYSVEYDECSTLISQSTLYHPKCNYDANEIYTLLVTSTPRSGTTTTYHVLSRSGIHVTHDFEKNIGSDGTISWMMAFKDSNQFGPQKQNKTLFKNIFHQVREPLSSITSMCTEPISEKSYLEFISRHINTDDWPTDPHELQNSIYVRMSFWYQWHDFLDKMGYPRYKIEDGSETWSVYASIFSKVPHMSDDTRVNGRTHRPKLSWNDLYTVDATLAKKIKEKSILYGYEYKDHPFRTPNKNPSCLI